MTHNVILYRDGPQASWGFRLQGGRDLGIPLSIQKVFLGTPSEGELRMGDVILRIGNKDATTITHEEALKLIRNAGNNVQITIQRGMMNSGPSLPFQTQSSRRPGSAPAGRPISPYPIVSLPKTQFSQNSLPKRFVPPPPPNNPSMQYQDDFYETQREKFAVTNQPFRSSTLILPGSKVRHDVPVGSYLRHVSDPFVRGPPSSGGKSHVLVNQANEAIMKAKLQESVYSAASNSCSSLGTSVGSPVRGRSETPDNYLPQVVHRQYNSPIYMYSPQNVAESIRGQTGVPVTPVHSGPRMKILDVSKSPTFQAIYEAEWKDLNKAQLQEHTAVQDKVKVVPQSLPGDHQHSFNTLGTPDGKVIQSKSFEMLNDILRGETNM